MWGTHEHKPTSTCVYMLSQLHTHYSWTSRVETHMPGHIPLSSYSLTAFPRLSALGMCSKSTKGWVKNSANVIRASGFLSSIRNRRSLQSLDTLAPGGSWCTKHDLIMLHSIHRALQWKGQEIIVKDLLVSHHYFLSKDDLKTLYVNPWVIDHMLIQSINLTQECKCFESLPSFKVQLPSLIDTMVIKIWFVYAAGKSGHNYFNC